MKYSEIAMIFDNLGVPRVRECVRECVRVRACVSAVRYFTLTPKLLIPTPIIRPPLQFPWGGGGGVQRKGNEPQYVLLNNPVYMYK